MSKYKVAQIGCGKMSVYTMRYCFEKGSKIVSAFDINPKIIGQDIGKVIGDGKNYKLAIQDIKDLKTSLMENKPDVAIVTTMSLINDVSDILTICAECGVNAITTCEEAFYPQNSNPKVFAKIDRLAKKNGCTICGSGYQDVFWGNLITTLAGATHTIKRIVGKSSYNVEDYGIALAKAHGAGLSLKDFDKKIAAADRMSEKKRQTLIADGKFMPSYMWNVNGWLASQLGLHVTSQVQACVPQTHTADLKSSTLKMTIKKGDATGMSAVVTTQTKEGIEIVSECIGKVYAKTDFDCNEWKIEGEPDTTVIINRPSTVELTCATTVNRIPDVIKAPNGYTTTEKMPRATYKLKSL